MFKEFKENDCEDLALQTVDKINKEFNKISKDEIERDWKKGKNTFFEIIRKVIKEDGKENCLYLFLDNLSWAPVFALVDKCCKNENGDYYVVPIVKEEYIEKYWKEKERKYFDEQYFKDKTPFPFP